jgi:hypothetical protein
MKFSLQRLDGMSEMDNHLVSFPHCVWQRCQEGSASPYVFKFNERVLYNVEYQQHLSLTYVNRAWKLSAVESMGWLLLVGVFDS